ncbi:MAG: dipicolinate synthase subunit DpsA [Bacillota bacterium]|nr:dipicolinate synthase subunit DpsA [Bacillota bacterium]MDW7682513.1 dipicolinate synthase subunit DpsA [Bacillota bacterium]
MQTISLAGCSVVIAGGDAREVVMAGELEKKGAQVWLYGFSRYQGPGSPCRQGLPVEADVMVFPLPGVGIEGYLYASYASHKVHLDDLESLLRPGLLLLCGRMPETYHKQLQDKGVNVILTADLDELAIYNAVPTAEGAVETAMRESDITIHGSDVLVTGFGRCAQPLALTLAGLGARVTVAARRREARAMAVALGLQAISVAELPPAAHHFDFLFNTVPAPVLTDAVLSGCKKGALIVDIASAPGGTDFDAARRLGIKSVLALGLPGKVAPVTAGKILADVYPYLINEHRKGGEWG